MLTDVKIRALTPRERTYRVSDGDGLALEVTPQGALLWRFRYRWLGKERMISLGGYPVVSLKEARFSRLDRQRELAKGQDLARVRRDKATGQLDQELSKFPVIRTKALRPLYGSVLDPFTGPEKRLYEKQDICLVFY